MMTQHSIVHIEFSAKDPKAAGDFYDQQEFKIGDIIPYISTDDIDATLAQIVSKGGRILKTKTEIPGIGWYAFFADPTGNRMGLYSGLTE
jgi:predicted enzyme related to lactoylglutathione lyase